MRRLWSLALCALASSAPREVDPYEHEDGRLAGSLFGLARAAGCSVVSARASWECIIEKHKPYACPIQVEGKAQNFALSYGEVSPAGIGHLLAWMHIEDSGPLSSMHFDDVFADLGSGCGHAVAQTFFSTAVRRVVGVEVSKERYDKNEEFRKRLLAYEDIEGVKSRSFELVHADARDTKEWDGATIALMNNVLFDDVLLHEMRDAVCTALRPGAILFSFRAFRGCRSDVLRKVGEIEVDTSWSKEKGKPTMVTAYLRLPEFEHHEPPKWVKKAWHSRNDCIRGMIGNVRYDGHGAGERLCTYQEVWKKLDHGLDDRCASAEIKHLSMIQRRKDAGLGRLEKRMKDRQSGDEL